MLRNDYTGDLCWGSVPESILDKAICTPVAHQTGKLNERWRDAGLSMEIRAFSEVAAWGNGCITGMPEQWKGRHTGNWERAGAFPSRATPCVTPQCCLLDLLAENAGKAGVTGVEKQRGD